MLSKYFIDGISLNDTLKNHNNIYDFCLRLKLNSAFTGEYNYITSESGFPEKKTLKLSKNTRFYISNQGGSFIK